MSNRNIEGGKQNGMTPPPKRDDPQKIHQALQSRNEMQNKLSGGARRRITKNKRLSNKRSKKIIRRKCKKCYKHTCKSKCKSKCRCKYCTKRRRRSLRKRTNRRRRKQRGGSGTTAQLGENCASASGGSGDTRDPNGAGRTCQLISSTAAQAQYGNKQNDFS